MLIIFHISFRMGSKTQSENKKLNVPGAGSYDLPEKVGILGYNKF